jgi:hypothetical protein
LIVHPHNPRYFTNHTGNALYMAGSQAWFILHKNGHEVASDRTVDFLDKMQAWGHTYTRIWSGWLSMRNEQGFQSPWPCERTGPGIAADGLLKFDLGKPNKEYFRSLHFLLQEIQRRGLFCSVMLFGSFNGWRKKEEFKSNIAWHPNNNINPETGSIENGVDFFNMAPSILELQKNYVRQFVDELNNYDNFIWELMNEAKLPESRDWQYHMIEYIREYEKKKPKQHLIIMSGGWSEAGEILYRSPAEVISPDSSNTDYFQGGPHDFRGKTIINDTDHMWGFSKPQDAEVYRKWAWMTFARGNHPIFMDDYDSYLNDNKGAINPVYDPVRLNLGYTASYARRFKDLARMVPEGNRSSTGYCLADRNEELLVYSPGRATRALTLRRWLDRIKGWMDSAPKDIRLEIGAGRYRMEWFDPIDNSITTDEVHLSEAALHSFAIPTHIKDDAVLYLHQLNRSE